MDTHQMTFLLIRAQNNLVSGYSETIFSIDLFRFQIILR